jgi:hypothetical protein
MSIGITTRSGCNESTTLKKKQNCKLNKKRIMERIVPSHPCRKNKDAARMGHPKFHPARVGNAGGRLLQNVSFPQPVESFCDNFRSSPFL